MILISMPSGAEWLLILLFPFLVLISHIITYHLGKRAGRKESRR